MRREVTAGRGQRERVTSNYARRSHSVKYDMKFTYNCKKLNNVIKVSIILA